MSIFSSTIHTNAQTDDIGFTLGIQDWRQVEVGLLTCAPQQLMYGHFGHTAIRVRNAAEGGVDLAFNYGSFSFDTNWFALKFLFGLTDYELSVVRMTDFITAYDKMGSQVTEQVLNLTEHEKQQIVKALVENAQPDKRVYRYNFFYQNCTTKARDVITDHLNGEITYNVSDEDEPTWREMLHPYTNDHAWAQFGEDLCLGALADTKANHKEQQFLPHNLLQQFATAAINTNGNRRPLVLNTRTVLPPGVQVSNEFPLAPWFCALLVLLLTVGVCLLEWRKQICLWGYDILFFGICGVAGFILAALFVSAHPTTSTNLCILLFNPLQLIFLPRITWRSIHHRSDWLWLAALLPLLLFILAAAFQLQQFPAALYLIFAAMLVRIGSHLTTEWRWRKGAKV